MNWAAISQTLGRTRDQISAKRWIWLPALGLLLAAYAVYAFLYGELRISLWLLVFLGTAAWNLARPARRRKDADAADSRRAR
ncbi:hypothetical protein IT575_07870 [bacterium]|nr:hypothetical protein [bacterium]